MRRYATHLLVLFIGVASGWIVKDSLSKRGGVRPADPSDVPQRIEFFQQTHNTGMPKVMVFTTATASDRPGRHVKLGPDAPDGVPAWKATVTYPGREWNLFGWVTTEPSP